MTKSNPHLPDNLLSPPPNQTPYSPSKFEAGSINIGSEHSLGYVAYEVCHSLYIIVNMGPYLTCSLQFIEAPLHFL
jgi:hypothetical protein